MAMYSGQGGTVTISAGGTLAVKKWSADVSQEVADVTNASSSGWRSRIPTVKSVKGTIDAVYDDTPTSGAWGESGTITCKLGGSSANLSGPAIITNVQYVSDAANDAVVASISFESNGAWTLG